MAIRKILIGLAFILVVLAGIGAVGQFLMLRKAHGTFDSYYAFRGCTQLLEKASTYGVCKTASGQVIKIVEFRGKWYLDGDLPPCVFRVCL